MVDFTSNQLCRLYLNGNGAFHPTTRINSFEKITTLSILEDIIDNFVNINNDNGGLTVIGWYNIGEINDQSNKDNIDGTERVGDGDIGYHFVHMYQKHYNADEYRLSELNMFYLMSEQFFIVNTFTLKSIFFGWTKKRDNEALTTWAEV